MLASIVAQIPAYQAMPTGIVTRASAPVMVERSAAIPFLKKPPALDG